MVDKNQRREELMDAALEVFLRYGPRKGTLEDVASKAGMATTSLYYYFKNKREIIRAVASREIDRLIVNIQQALEQPGSYEERLARMWQVTFERFNINMDIDEFIEVLQYSMEFLGRLEEFQDAQVRKLLSEGVESGQLHIKDMDLAVIIVVNAMRGTGHALIRGENPNLVHQATEKLARLLIHGMQLPLSEQ